MWSLVGTLLLGLALGLLSCALFPERGYVAWIAPTILSILGAFWASYAGYALGMYAEESGFSWIASALGALLVLLLYRLVRGPSHKKP